MSCACLGVKIPIRTLHRGSGSTLHRHFEKNRCIHLMFDVVTFPARWKELDVCSNSCFNFQSVLMGDSLGDCSCQLVPLDLDPVSCDCSTHRNTPIHVRLAAELPFSERCTNRAVESKYLIMK